MFWNDIEDIKKDVRRLEEKIDKMSPLIEKLAACACEVSSTPIRCDGDRVIDAGVEDIKEMLCDVFCSENDNNTINRLHDKLDSLIKDGDRAKDVLISEKILDKFNDYMGNVDKLNSMINEFKGCVSMARGAITEGKELMKLIEEMGKVADISQNIHKSMLSFIKAGNNIEQTKFFKIDAIYAAICEKQEKKPRKKKKAIKVRKAASPDL